MNEDQFEGAASLEAAGLWKTFTSALIKEFSSQLNMEPEEIKDTAKTGFNRFINFLDEQRKKSAVPDSEE